MLTRVIAKQRASLAILFYSIQSHLELCLVVTLVMLYW